MLETGNRWANYIYCQILYKNYYLSILKLLKNPTILLVLNHLYLLSDLNSLKFMFQYIMFFVV